MHSSLEQLKQRFDEFDSREKILITVGGIALFFIFFIFIIYLPGQEKIATIQEQIRFNQEDVQWMQSASKQLQGSGQTRNVSGLNRSLLALLDEQFKAAGIASTVKSIQPDGKDKANVRIENCSFDSLVSLIGTLESNNNVTVLRASLEKATDIGRVSGSVTFNRS